MQGVGAIRDRQTFRLYKSYFSTTDDHSPEIFCSSEHAGFCFKYLVGGQEDVEVISHCGFLCSVVNRNTVHLSLKSIINLLFLL